MVGVEGTAPAEGTVPVEEGSKCLGAVVGIVPVVVERIAPAMVVGIVDRTVGGFADIHLLACRGRAGNFLDNPP